VGEEDLRNEMELMKEEGQRAGGGPGGRERGPRRPRTHSRLTERDRAIAEWIERVGVAGVDDVARRFGVGRVVTYRRLAALCETGWIRSWRPFAEAGVWYPAGAKRPKVRELNHQLSVVALVVDLERAGEKVITEREMRQDDVIAVDTAQRWSIELSALRSSTALERPTHRPDFAVQREHELEAFELELSQKSRARLERLLGAWARQGRYGQVRYLCASGAIARAVQVASERAGAGRVARVEQVDVGARVAL